MRIVEDDAFGRIRRLIKGKAATGGPNKLNKGDTVTAEILDGIGRYDWFDIRLSDEEAARQLRSKDGLSQAAYRV